MHGKKETRSQQGGIHDRTIYFTDSKQLASKIQRSRKPDEYLKYSFYPYALVSFSSVFMLNKCPNALKVHFYDQVIHLVELCKIGGKTATKATGEATAF